MFEFTLWGINWLVCLMSWKQINTEGIWLYEILCDQMGCTTLRRLSLRRQVISSTGNFVDDDASSNSFSSNRHFVDILPKIVDKIIFYFNYTWHRENCISICDRAFAFICIFISEFVSQLHKGRNLKFFLISNCPRTILTCPIIYMYLPLFLSNV